MRAPTGLSTQFVGQRGAVIKLALKAGIWTILTLGFYRFWMKTQLRRWYWSSIRPGGTPLEYVGDPLEKLLGFFMAVVILAFYIGVVNLILMFASLSLFASSFTAYLTSFLGVIPIWFFARYRARRYVLARTRWRGVRFGLKNGAWGYAIRALWHWILTLITLGALWPRKAFYLEKYVTDRTRFGSITLHQGGTWQMLLPAFAPVIVGMLLLAVAISGAVLEQAAVAFLAVVAVPATLAAIIYYNVEATRLLAQTKTAGDVGLSSRPKPATIGRIYGFGYLATTLIVMLPLIPISVAVATFEMQRLGAQWGGDEMAGQVLGFPIWAWTAMGLLTYFGMFLLWFVLRHAFVTMPLMRHYAQTLTIENPAALANVTQRSRDEFREAEGFAEALDLWGAI